MRSQIGVYLGTRERDLPKQSSNAASSNASREGNYPNPRLAASRVLCERHVDSLE